MYQCQLLEKEAINFFCFWHSRRERAITRQTFFNLNSDWKVETGETISFVFVDSGRYSPILSDVIENPCHRLLSCTHAHGQNFAIALELYQIHEYYQLSFIIIVYYELLLSFIINYLLLSVIVSLNKRCLILQDTMIEFPCIFLFIPIFINSVRVDGLFLTCRSFNRLHFHSRGISAPAFRYFYMFK